MSVLKKIIDKLESTYNSVCNDNWVDNSRCVSVLNKLDISKLADDIIECCKQEACEPKRGDMLFQFNKDYFEPRKNLTFTQKNNSPESFKIDSIEVFLERIYTYFNSEINNENEGTISNQYAIGKSGKEAVDIRIEKKNFVEYVELKCLNNKGYADTPLFAVIECLKNYYISAERVNIKTLTVLAPTDYWIKKLKNQEEFDKFISLVNLLNEKLSASNVRIELSFLELKNEDFRECTNVIREVLTAQKKFVPARTANKQYDLVATVPVEDIWQDIKDLALFSKLKKFELVQYSDLT